MLKKWWELAAMFQQWLGKHPWDCVLKTLDQGSQNIGLNKQEFFRTLDLTCCKGSQRIEQFAAGTLRSIAKVMVSTKWNRNAWVFPAQDIGRNSLGKVVMLEWIYYVRSKDLLGDYAQQEGPEDAPLTKAIRNELVKGGPVSLKMFSDDKPQCENCNVDPWDFGTLECLLQQRIKCLLINCPWHVTVSWWRCKHLIMGHQLTLNLAA